MHVNFERRSEPDWRLAGHPVTALRQLLSTREPVQNLDVTDFAFRSYFDVQLNRSLVAGGFHLRGESRLQVFNQNWNCFGA